MSGDPTAHRRHREALGALDPLDAILSRADGEHAAARRLAAAGRELNLTDLVTRVS